LEWGSELEVEHSGEGRQKRWRADRWEEEKTSA
jgi:hypothetical protein